VQEADDAPQIIENRGRPVAVVISAAEYERIETVRGRRNKWQEMLALAADLRADGGVDLKLPRRERRRSPLARGA
jgi:prevent-host-death family protein